MYERLNRIKNNAAKKRMSVNSVFLGEFEKKVYSQHGEDGVLEKIFELIGTDSKYYVEFGVEDGNESNTRYLREGHGFHGLLMDGGNCNPHINLQQEMIFAENINDLFAKYKVPYQFDLLSVDIDFNDYWVWKALDTAFRPSVIVAEINASLGSKDSLAIAYDPQGRWDGTRYFGASLMAFYQLARERGYSLVYMEFSGTNAFFIRDDKIDKSMVSFLDLNDVAKIYRYPIYGPKLISGKYGPCLCKGHPPDPRKRKFVRV